MKKTISDILFRIENDPWRESQPFSSDIFEAQTLIFKAAKRGDKERITEFLGAWLQRYQPCLFGRIAARMDLVEYCILLDDDLSSSDEEIMQQIQKARTTWTREGFSGRKSAFVILAISEKLANGLPNNTMQELAQRLCFLYLLQEIDPDQIYFDELFLEIPGNNRTTWKWPTGLNYFSAQGDGRWWHDHRIPGGLGFSINSIGHMVKAGLLAKGMNEMLNLVDSSETGWVPSLVDSLEKSLDLAMRTIAVASDTLSGKATFLLPLNEKESRKLPKCPIKLPKLLADKNYCEYGGFYHTDYTIPSEYFEPAVERPIGIKKHSLDFTYLFVKGVENPDHHQMGSGIKIRSKGETEPSNTDAHFTKGIAIEVPIQENPRLIDSLRKL